MESLFFACPVCGADVPRRAKACPDCGACEKSGWSEDQYLDGVNLTEEEYEYEAPRALGNGGRMTFTQRLWMAVAILVVIAMAWLTLHGLW